MVQYCVQRGLATGVIARRRRRVSAVHAQDIIALNAVGSISVREIARRSGVPRTTVRRILSMAGVGPAAVTRRRQLIPKILALWDAGWKRDAIADACATTTFVNYCHHRGLAAKAYLTFGTDPIEELTNLAEKIYGEFPHSIFFTSKLIFERDNWYIRQLHSEAALTMLRRLHLRNMPMVILPMKL